MSDPTGIAAVFASVTQAVSQVITWMGSWLNAITGNDILLFFCLSLPILTLGITIIKRLLSVRA